MDPQKTKEILNKEQSWRHHINWPQNTLQLQWPTEQNRGTETEQTTGNGPAHQFPAVFVVVFVCLVLFFIEAIRIHMEENKVSSIIGRRQTRHPKQEKLNPTFYSPYDDLHVSHKTRGGAS